MSACPLQCYPEAETHHNAQEQSIFCKAILRLSSRDLIGLAPGTTSSALIHDLFKATQFRTALGGHSRLHVTSGSGRDDFKGFEQQPIFNFTQQGHRLKYR